MSEANWKASLGLVLGSEGGNDDDKDDHGGRTSRGITQREYDAWCLEHNWPTGDVWKAPQSAIEAIYHDEYWNPYCDSLPIGVDYLYFDMAVNSGPHEATILLQRALGLNADGRIGPITRQAIKNANPVALTNAFYAQKAAFYQAISTHPGQRKFLRGWLNRNNETKAAAMQMIQKGPIA